MIKFEIDGGMAPLLQMPIAIVFIHRRQMLSEIMLYDTLYHFSTENLNRNFFQRSWENF